MYAEGVTEQDDAATTDLPALHNKKRRVKVDLKVKVIPKKKSTAQSDAPSSSKVLLFITLL